MPPRYYNEGGAKWGWESDVNIAQGGLESQPRALYQEDQASTKESLQCPVCKDSPVIL